jgi:choline kinase
LSALDLTEDEGIIITVDNDVIYEKRWAEELVKAVSEIPRLLLSARFTPLFDDTWITIK